MRNTTLRHNSILIVLGLVVTIIFFWVANTDNQQATYENPKIRAAFEDVAEISHIKKVIVNRYDKLTL